MSKRIAKIWGVSLTIMLLVSMFGAAVPVSAAIGNQQFVTQPVPDATGFVLANGTDVTDIAVARDGRTVYVIDAQTAAPGKIYKSIDGGQSFADITTGYPGVLAPVAIDVAPDNADSIVVTDGDGVFTSNNGGTSWATLPNPTAVGATATDVTIGPARSGTLLGRDYAVSIADDATATFALGDVMVIGTTATWTTVAAGVVTTRDYMSVKFTPNFVGDRGLVALGARNAAGVGEGRIEVQLFNTANAPAGAITRRATLAGLTASTIDYDAPAGGVAAASILKADISLPTDYDATSDGGRVAYVSIAADTTFTDNDVYRINGNQSRFLAYMGSGGVPVWSVAFGGTVSGGTLLAGRMDDGEVVYSTNPTVSSPTWTSHKKLSVSSALAAAQTNSVVRMASDFATSNKAYAGVAGVESSFMIATDGGQTFNGEALIDNGVGNTLVQIQSVQLSPDGKTLFIASDDVPGAAGQISVWKTVSPIANNYSWQRVYAVTKFVALTSTAMLRISPDYATTPAIFLQDVSLNGPLFRSTNGGGTFASRIVPLGVTPADIAVQNADVLYLLANDVKVHKSTVGGWTWADAVDSKVTAPVFPALPSIAIAKADHILVGGNATFSYSTDGAATFTKVDGNGAEIYMVAGDADYANNNTIYALNTAAGANYRYKIGTDAALVNLGTTAAAAAVGVGQKNKVLYIASAAKVDRSLDPLTTPGNIRWTAMDTPAPVIARENFTIAVDNNVNTLYAANLGIILRGYQDFLATAKPTLTSPADNFNLAIDPVGGRADAFTLVINSMGTDTGLVKSYHVQMWEKSGGVAASLLSGALGVTSPTTPEIRSTVMAADGVLGGMFPLRANTEYQYRVRAADEVSLDAITSLWSDTRTIKVQSGGSVIQTQTGPILLAPTPGGTTVPVSTGFAWAPVFGATKYEVILATDAALTKRVAGTPVQVTSPAWNPAAPLAASTTYFYSVKAIEPTISVEAIGSFTTATPAAPAPTAAPTVTVTPPAPAPVIIPAPIGPGYLWAIIGIGAILVIAVIVLIVKTRRVA